MKSIYFIGIGGIGMSALASWYRAQNWAVSGSDLAKSHITEELREEGVKVHIGHKKGNIKATLGLVVYNRAIPTDNPELLAAKSMGVPILPYAEVLGELTEKHKTIAITGSHGKSTTTALAGLILSKAGLDPTVLVGTGLKEFGGKNVRFGKSKYLVLEADDFGKAFLHYSPSLAIITNIDREHLDTYRNLAGVQKAFLQFIGKIKIGGTAVLNKDDRNLLSLKREIERIAHERKIRILWYSIHGNTAKDVRRVIRIPGDHNASNAVGAYKIARVLGVPHATIISAIGAYRGSWRRFDYRGDLKSSISNRKTLIYDDYAHHPTEIRATLQGFREKFPKAEIICVFQPHQAKRLKALFKEFQTAFDGANTTIILPIYRVAGRDEYIPGYDSEALVRVIQKKQPKKLIFYLNDPKNLKSALKTLLSPARDSLPATRYSPVLVMMGAGDIANYTDALVAKTSR